MGVLFRGACVHVKKNGCVLRVHMHGCVLWVRMHGCVLWVHMHGREPFQGSQLSQRPVAVAPGACRSQQ